jgi:hypothetical protein
MNQLEDRVTSLLARTAAAIEVRPDVDRVLHPGGPTEHQPPRGGEPARSRPRRLLPAAALVVVVALAGATAVALRDGRRAPDAEPADTVTVGDPPDGWIVPTWVPEGLQPWTVEWHTTLPEPTGDMLPQLFGNPDGGRALLVTSYYEMHPDGVSEVTVRGRTGQAGPGMDEGKDMGDGIGWEERGLELTALFRGMSADEAIAALDALEWRSDDPADGFAPPDGGPLPLHAEASREPSAGRDTMLLYSDGPPPSGVDDGRLGLQIFTSTNGTLPGRYLEAWYQQGPAAGGGERPLTSFDEDRHGLSVLWPDGRSIDITPIGLPQADLPGREVLQRVADSTTAMTDADLTTQRAAAETATAALPVVASAETRIGTLTVQGDDSFLRLCHRGPSDPAPSCPVDDFGSGVPSDDGTAHLSDDWIVDGEWYVVVASTGEPPLIIDGRDSGTPLDADELPAETATAGDWTIRLVQPAPDIEVVCIGSGTAMGCTDDRPT